MKTRKTMTENKQLNIYQKIQAVKSELMQRNLKKSWKNAYAGFEYFELSDILPSIIELCNKYNLFTYITFDNDLATLWIKDSEWGAINSWVMYTSPMRELELKGCNQIQALGGVETYQRRYLYMNAFDICESDSFDAVAWDEKKSEKKIPSNTVQEEPSKTDTSVSDEKPRFNKENLDKFVTIAKQYKSADEALKEIKQYYRISKENEGKVRRLYEDLELINS